MHTELNLENGMLENNLIEIWSKINNINNINNIIIIILNCYQIFVFL